MNALMVHLKMKTEQIQARKFEAISFSNLYFIFTIFRYIFFRLERKKKYSMTLAT